MKKTFLFFIYCIIYANANSQTKNFEIDMGIPFYYKFDNYHEPTLQPNSSSGYYVFKYKPGYYKKNNIGGRINLSVSKILKNKFIFNYGISYRTTTEEINRDLQELTEFINYADSLNNFLYFNPKIDTIWALKEVTDIYCIKPYFMFGFFKNRFSYHIGIYINLFSAYFNEFTYLNSVDNFKTNYYFYNKKNLIELEIRVQFKIFKNTPVYIFYAIDDYSFFGFNYKFSPHSSKEIR